VENTLAGIPVASVMNPAPEALSPNVSVNDFVVDHAMRGQRAMPVVEDGKLIGIMSVTDAKHLATDAWPTTTVRDVMTRSPLTTVTPDDSLATAFDLIVAHGVHQLPVVNADTLVGMVTRADVMGHLHSRSGNSRQPSAVTFARTT
jgi:CBS domain-containing protein